MAGILGRLSTTWDLKINDKTKWIITVAMARLNAPNILALFISTIHTLNKIL